MGCLTVFPVECSTSLTFSGPHLRCDVGLEEGEYYVRALLQRVDVLLCSAIFLEFMCVCVFNCSVLYVNWYGEQRIMLTVCSDKFDINGKLVCLFPVATSVSGYTQLGLAAIVTGVHGYCLLASRAGWTLLSSRHPSAVGQEDSV